MKTELEEILTMSEDDAIKAILRNLTDNFKKKYDTEMVIKAMKMYGLKIKLKTL